MGETRLSGKAFDIPKRLVWKAYRKVRANKGAAGVDGQSLADFEQDEKNNLYKIWNRMSSGTYFPPPVRAVEISKAGRRGVRVLGVPTVADRIAQTVVAMVLEPGAERVFHPDSYGYRPRRSALDALDTCRRRCWEQRWVIDLDIQGFFDNVPHEPIMAAVGKHTELPWVSLYVQRWLTAPIQLADGTLRSRDRGTPQGSAISPLLSNLFMHYAFDSWLSREHTHDGGWQTGFLPAVSKAAMKEMARTIRSWRLGRRTDLSFTQIAAMINPVAGWINYYGHFYKSLLINFLGNQINPHLVKWACRKYKHLHRWPAKARRRIARIASDHPLVFAHWRHGALPSGSVTGAV